MFRSEGQALNFIRSRVAKGTIINADESNAWNDLHARYEMKRINHEEAYSLNGACTNMAEGFFSRLRRASHHHHVAGAHCFCATLRKPHGARITAVFQMAIR